MVVKTLFSGSKFVVFYRNPNSELRYLRNEVFQCSRTMRFAGESLKELVVKVVPLRTLSGLVAFLCSHHC